MGYSFAEHVWLEGLRCKSVLGLILQARWRLGGADAAARLADRLRASPSLLPGDAASEMLGQSADRRRPSPALRDEDGPERARPTCATCTGSAGLVTGQPGSLLANDMPVAELIAGRLPKSLMLAR